jgi:hypothetical protein
LTTSLVHKSTVTRTASISYKWLSILFGPGFDSLPAGALIFGVFLGNNRSVVSPARQVKLKVAAQIVFKPQ